MIKFGKKIAVAYRGNGLFDVWTSSDTLTAWQRHTVFRVDSTRAIKFVSGYDITKEEFAEFRASL